MSEKYTADVPFFFNLSRISLSFSTFSKNYKNCLKHIE